MARLLAGLACALGLAACDETTKAPESAPALASVRLSTPTAFEWVALRDGAALVFAPRDDAAGAVVRWDFTRDARPKSEKPARVLPPELAQGEVTDLAATAVGEALALAWVERERGKARAFGAFVGAHPPRRVELGATVFPARAARGNVTLVKQRDAALAFARLAETSCVNPNERGCSAFELFTLSPEGAKTVGLPLVVPSPCADHSALLAVAGERFHYALCAGSEAEPRTTWFSIQPDPEYARADQVLAGCRPLAAFSWDGAAYLVGDCERGRRFARVPGGDERIEEGELDSASCDAGKLGVRLGERRLVFSEPRAGLHAFFDTETLPRGARAVWTGAALLVADAPAARLSLSRFTCEGNVLRRAALEAAPLEVR
jgi:hypothetical protein